jgi:SAM-dependent methyltransferase
MSDPYDALAPHYREYAARKSTYLEAVDALILAHTPVPSTSLLDVGAGDGLRGLSLARRMGATRTVLADQSAEMAALCRTRGVDEVWHCAAQDLRASSGQFDIILCLWNVLGHIPDPSARIQALRRMAELLSPTGRLFIDVNNRHNAASYGHLRVLGRRAIDALFPDYRRGDASFEWHVGGKIFPTTGHLFTPAEIASIISDCELKIIKRIAVDYGSGIGSHNPFNGQLLFILGK